MNTNGIEDCALYDGKLLKDLAFDDHCCANYKPYISPQNPGEGLQMRPLQISDYDKGYMDLLSQLTKVGNVSREEFEAQFHQMLKAPNLYFVTVIEDLATNQIVGSATLVKELKFIRQCSARGRIEDVVVNNTYQGKQLGKLLVDVLTILSKHVGCYKVSLECLDNMVPFYSKFGFAPEEGQNYMCRRYQAK